MAYDQWTTLIDVNLTGVRRTMKAAVPHMLSAENGGSPFVVSSAARINASPCRDHYSASKHGVTGLSKSAASSLVNTVSASTPSPLGRGLGDVRGDPMVEKTFTAHPNFAMSYGSVMPHLPLADANDYYGAAIWLASDLSDRHRHS
jgi:NAD(P)-dependent dehydrogenase (short-subunit alcohol dehydrogenase family)